LFTWTNNSLLITGLLTIGIPHGAVDHLLNSDKTIKRPTVGFIVRYLTCVIALFIVWMITPQLSLLFFIVYSSWHFGESDLFHWGISKNKVTTSWIWGSALLLLILSSHFSESRKIIIHLGIDLPVVLIDYAPYFSAVLIFGMLILVKVTRNYRMFLSLILLICSIQLPLLTAFGLYFIGQHSLNSWGHIKKGLAITNKQFVLKALPFTLGSFFLFGILFYLIKNEIIMVQNYNWTAIIFIFISCISLPHILVIHSFYTNKK
jgi:Brp/Blh family beta-carotene 15,15'-monooxygenase